MFWVRFIINFVFFMKLSLNGGCFILSHDFNDKLFYYYQPKSLGCMYTVENNWIEHYTPIGTRFNSRYCMFCFIQMLKFTSWTCHSTGISFTYGCSIQTDGSLSLSSSFVGGDGCCLTWSWYVFTWFTMEHTEWQLYVDNVEMFIVEVVVVFCCVFIWTDRHHCTNLDRYVY